MNAKTLAAAGAILTLTLTACGATAPDPAADPAVTPEAQASTAPLAPPAEETSAADSYAAAFGDLIEWDTGVKVRISVVGTGTLSDTGYVDGDLPAGTEFVIFQTDVLNDGSRPLDSSMFSTPVVSYDAAGVTEVAPEVYDDEVPSEVAPSLMPGKTLSMKSGYVIPADARSEVYAEFAPEDYMEEGWVTIGFWAGPAEG